MTPGPVPCWEGGRFIWIHAALARVGITDDRLAEVASQGLEAYDTRVISKDGVVTDERQVPDFAARHKFWRDLMMVKGYLGADRESGGWACGELRLRGVFGRMECESGKGVGGAAEASRTNAARVLAADDRSEQPAGVSDEDDYDDWSDREEH